MRTLITGALIVDGTGAEPRRGSVALEGDTIIGVGELEPGDFEAVIDANGLALSPGFIDTHSHSDLEVFRDNRLLPKICQGVTTEILGQDGVSLAPLPEPLIGPWRKNIAGLEGDLEEFEWTLKTTSRYLELLERNRSATNLLYLAPHGNVRLEAMGLDGRTATEPELARMESVLARELAAGCHGLSTGLIYPPCAYADTREVERLCRVAAREGLPLVVHQRSEADDIIASVNEILSVGRATGVPIHFSHFKLCGKNNAPLFGQVLDLLDEARGEGLTISFDQYPYVAGSTMLGVILPPWVHDGGTDRLLERLRDPAARKRIVSDIRGGIPGWDNFVAFAGVEGILVTSVKTAKNASAVGLSLAALGEAKGVDPLDAAMDLLAEEDNAVGMVDYYGLEEHVEALLRRPEQNVCTDGLMSGNPHPRAYGAFPRVLGRYVRERKVLSLSEAVRKMTSKPASVFGLKDRGRIFPGLKADLVLFDPETIIDVGTFENPRRHPIGIQGVWVNGRPAIRDGEFVEGALHGRVLKRQGA